jgi:gluconolactonase
VKANVDRWINQFHADGRKAKVTAGKAELGQYVIVDVEGTYKKPVGPPIAGKTEDMKDARMLAAILAVEGKGNFFLKLTGENKTVTAAAEAFRASFGSKQADEKPFELE